jgi:hypothetical protein
VSTGPMGRPAPPAFGRNLKQPGRGSQLLRVDTDYDLVYRGLASDVTLSSPLS